MIKLAYGFCLFLLAVISCYAEVYEAKIGASTLYSDTPRMNSHAVNYAKTLNTIQSTNKNNNEKSTIATNARELNKSDNTSKPSADNYQKFEITSPQDQENLHNQHQLSINVQIEPKLKPDHLIALIIDGKQHGEKQSIPIFIIQDLARGEHQLYAELFNSNGQAMQKTKSITIYMHYTNLHTAALVAHSRSRELPKIHVLPNIHVN